MIVARRPVRIVERNALAYRRIWYVFLTGFAEPVLYLLSIGVGVGRLVGDLPGPAGHLVPYRTFVAPGLLASSAALALWEHAPLAAGWLAPTPTHSFCLASRSPTETLFAASYTDCSCGPG